MFFVFYQKMPHIITKEAYEKLKEEIKELETTKRREIAERIQKAKDLGDLSENAEYSEAKEAQAFNEGRILELKALVKDVTVAKAQKGGGVGLGSKVKVRIGGKKEKVFTIVSFNEADPLEGKISNESPIGAALIGGKEGDRVAAETPKGEAEYEILAIL